MITQKYINSLLEEYAKSQRGKKEIADFRRAIFSGQIAGDQNDGAKMTKSQMIETAKMVKQLLFKHIVEVIPSFKESTIIVGRPKETSDGNYEMNISFNETDLHRDSLYPEKYDGLENIVLLFTNGYSAKNNVYGVWHRASGEDIPTKSRLTREPNDFLEDAIDEFYSTPIKNVLVQLEPKYAFNEEA